MANFALRIKARNLRSEGQSIKDIAKMIHASKSSVSTWVRDVELSGGLLAKLKTKELEGAMRGRLKVILINREKRSKILEEARKAGVKELKKITNREFLIGGLALYWGEGGKKNRRVEFCNSDPKMVQFLLLWLEKCFGIKKEEMVCNVGINEIHVEREKEVKEYWSKITGLSLDQFRKTSFKRISNKKVYANFKEHFGTLTVNVHKSTSLYCKLLGLIEGFSHNTDKLANVAQR